MASEIPGEGRRHGRARALPVCLILIQVLWASVAAGQSSGRVTVPDNPLKGRLTFESKGCSNCHTMAGQPSGVGPRLGEGRFGGSFLDLGAALWNHVPGMSVRFEAEGLTWPEISERDAVELTSFLYFIEYLGQPGRAAAGERVYSAKGCARCHSIGGEASDGLDLSGLKLFASPLYISQAIWNHGPSMLESMRDMGVSPPKFEESDLADLSAYIRQTTQPGPQERIVLSPGNPNNGQSVFRDKGCASCHATGGGGRIGSGPDLTRSELHRSAESIAGKMWNHALEMRESMRERGIAWPSFTATELADLIAFLYFLPFADRAGDPDKGREIFAQRSCSDCHADQGSAHPGPDLLSSEAASSPALLVAAMWNHAPVMKEAIVSEGRPWPELTGDDLRDLLAFLRQQVNK